MCQNPFRECDRPGVGPEIQIRGNLLSLCLKCWNELGESDVEWSSEDGSVTGMDSFKQQKVIPNTQRRRIKDGKGKSRSKPERNVGKKQRVPKGNHR
jgi:hypothetical protein